MKKATYLSVVLVHLAIISNAFPQENQLIKNGTLDRGHENWEKVTLTENPEGIILEWRPDEGVKGGCLHVAVTPEATDYIAVWNQFVENPPLKKRIRFSATLRGQGIRQGAQLTAIVMDEAREKTLAFQNNSATDPLMGDFDWKRIEITVAVPEGAGWIRFSTGLVGVGELWIDDLSAVVDGDATEEELKPRDPFASIVPGIFRMRGEYEVSLAKDEVGEARPVLLFPLPLCYREQVPLTYQVKAEPSDKLASVQVYEDHPGNFVARVTLNTPDAGRTVRIRWSSVVLCAPRSFDDVPETAPFPETWPEETLPWLKSTACVQSDHERLIAEAKKFRGEEDDVLAVIHASLDHMREIRKTLKDRALGLDALKALDGFGSCTSNANLAAALLRAAGIPARSLSGYPLWYGALQTHYIVEAFVPGYGWYPFESTMLRAPWPPHRQLNVSIIPPEHEDRSEARPAAAPGVPYLSLTEYDHAPGLFRIVSNIDGKDYCDHVAEKWRPFPDDLPDEDWKGALERARDRWLRWVRGQEEKMIPLADPTEERLKEVDNPGALLGLLEAQ